MKILIKSAIQICTQINWTYRINILFRLQFDPPIGSNYLHDLYTNYDKTLAVSTM